MAGTRARLHLCKQHTRVTSGASRAQSMNSPRLVATIGTVDSVTKHTWSVKGKPQGYDGLTSPRPLSESLQVVKRDARGS